MDRRAFIIGSVAALAAPVPGEAEPVPRVGFVTTTPALRDAFVGALRRLGYQDGRNIAIDWRPNPDAEARDVEDLVKLKPDCLFLAGPVNLAHGRKLTNTIPIVTIDLESDPVASGVVSSLAHPGGNVTGIFLDFPELAGKQIQFLQELLPALKRLAVMWQDPVAGPQLRAAEAAARAAGIAVIQVAVRAPADLERAVVQAMAAKAQALLVLTGPMLFPNRARIVDDAARHRLPLASVFPGFAQVGGLLGYGPDQAELFIQAATYVDRILKGARAADLPIERPTKFSLVINLKTAKALGLTVPPSLLGRADQLIQ
jgi:putative ABC transport system substrate-binding protein